MNRVALTVLLALAASAASAAPPLTDEELRACLAQMISIDLIEEGFARPSGDSVFSGRLEGPLEPDTPFHRQDRVLTIENRARGFVPPDPGLPWIDRRVLVWNRTGWPLATLSYYAASGRHGEPWPHLGGAAVLSFPGGLVPYAPYDARVRLSAPPQTGAGTAEVLLVPLDATDAEGRSFLRDFGQALCATPPAPMPPPPLRPGRGRNSGGGG